ncbi:MAG: PQQ-like beta-propeller repeat protein [Candidatus Lokiarchaeota archaeon]|nr:PQQ-like beta-propeller repeat protein [Candidatus Lokiarchaeota archaeon]
MVIDIDDDGKSEILHAGNIYTGSAITCLYGTNGTIKWRTPINPSNNQYDNRLAAADIDGDGQVEIVYTTSDSTLGKLGCLAGRTGLEKWEITTTLNLSGPMILDNKTAGGFPLIVTGSSQGNATCFSNTGTMIWNHHVEQMISPEGLGDVDNDGIVDIIMHSANTLCCIASNNGSIKWQRSWPFKNLKNIGLADVDRDGQIEVVIAVPGNATCFSAKDGQKKWSTPCAIMQGCRNLVLCDVDSDGIIDACILESTCIAALSGMNGSRSVVMLQGAYPGLSINDVNMDDKLEFFTVFGVPGMHIFYYTECDTTDSLAWSRPGPWPCWGGSNSRSQAYIDSDNDTLPTDHELDLLLDPSDSDTDGDGIDDGTEIAMHTDPLDPQDPPTGELRISHPADVSYEYQDEGNDLTWVITDNSIGAANYTITCDGEPVASGNWTSGSSIQISVDGHCIGTYNYTIVASDGLGGTVQDSVIVIVHNVSPAVLHPADITYPRGSTGNRITWVITDNSTWMAIYTILHDNETVDAGNWTSNIPVIISVDGLNVGTYFFMLIAYDGLGGIVEDSVTVTVVSSSTEVIFDAYLWFSILAGFSMLGIGIILVGLKVKRAR